MRQEPVAGLYWCDACRTYCFSSRDKACVNINCSKVKASRSRDKGEPQQQQRDVAGAAGNRQEQHDKRASADPGDDHRGAWKAGSKRKRDDDESEKSTKTHKPAKEDHAEEEFKEEEECDAKGQRWRKIGARVSEIIEANPLAELDA